jgi:hypothetical protein
MSNNFQNIISKQVLNLRDMNELISELSLAIIQQAQLATPPNNLPVTYYQPFINGKILDNWGVDLYRSDNLQTESNKQGIEYFLTYQVQPDQSQIVDNCNFNLVCDFSFLLPDCNPSIKGTSKQRITRMTDLFIESIVNNQTVFIADVETALDNSQNLTEKNRYRCSLCSSQLLNRFELNGKEKLNSTNYFTSTFTIKFFIQKL